MLKVVRSFDLKGKRVLIRVDFNVPVSNDMVTDDFRIRGALPTIQHCLKQGASVVLMSHLGRPNGEFIPEMSLMPVGETLSGLLEIPIKFSENCISEDACDTSLGLKSGEVHLLENLRFHKEESENDPIFSSILAKHGSVYINDAFGTAHREHASNTGVTSFFTHKGIGFLIEKELQYLKDVIKKPKRPLTLVLGGSKISGKIKLINKFIEESDNILVGGGMVFSFLKARGRNVGTSLHDDESVNAATRILERARSLRVNIEFPDDIVVAPDIETPEKSIVCGSRSIPEDMAGFDIGPDSVEKFKNIILNSGTVIWNGPMGVFELKGFEGGTKGIAQAMADSAQSGNIMVVGGGDTAAAVKQFNLSDRMSHVSTGGGASLELLSGNTLPAISVLE